MTRWLGWVLVSMMVMGCAASTRPARTYEPLRVPMDLPSKATLEAIAKRPLPELPERKEVEVDAWTFDGAWLAPSDEAPALPPEMAAAVEEQGAESAPDLHCMAEQVARLFLAHAGLPSDRLASYMLARCGLAVTENLGMSVATLEGLGQAKDAEVLAALLPTVRERLPELMSQGAKTFGTWIHREGDRAAVAVVASRREITVTYGPVDDQGRVVIRGTLPPATEQRPAPTEVDAIVNHGAHAWAPCQVKATLPSFVITCQLARDDDSAWIGISTKQPGRMLSNGVARLLVHRRGRQAIAFAPVERGTPAVDVETFRGALLAELNRARQAAGLRPATLAPAQSRAVDAVSPAFFVGNEAGDDELLDQISLGVVAGWDVGGGFIRDANFVAILGQSDARSWLAGALEQPMGRRTLLDPEADQIALGATLNEPFPGAGVLVATYEMFDPATREADAQAIVAALNAHRRARGVAPAIVNNEIVELDQAAANIAAGMHPGEALDIALYRLAARGLDAQGAWGFTTSVTEPPLLPELATPPSLAVGVRAIHHHLPGSNWGFFVLLFVAFPDHASPQLAAADPVRAAG